HAKATVRRGDVDAVLIVWQQPRTILVSRLHADGQAIRRPARGDLSVAEHVLGVHVVAGPIMPNEERPALAVGHHVLEVLVARGRGYRGPDRRPAGSSGAGAPH